jgi:hypothetical protein
MVRYDEADIINNIKLYQPSIVAKEGSKENALIDTMETNHKFYINYDRRYKFQNLPVTFSPAVIAM